MAAESSSSFVLRKEPGSHEAEAAHCMPEVAGCGCCSGCCSLSRSSSRNRVPAADIRPPTYSRYQPYPLLIVPRGGPSVSAGDGHSKAARVWYDPNRTSYKSILDAFFLCRPPAAMARPNQGSKRDLVRARTAQV